MDRMSVVKDGVDIDEVDQEQHLNDEIRMRHCSGYIDLHISLGNARFEKVRFFCKFTRLRIS